MKNYYVLMDKYLSKITKIIYILFVLSTSITVVGYFNLNNNYTIPMIMKYIRFICYGLCAFIFIYNCLTKKYSINAIIVYSILYILAIIFYVISKDLVLLKSILLASVVYKKEYKELIAFSLIIQTLILFLTITCSKLGLIDNSVFLDGNRTRYFLGFSYVSFSNMFFLFTVLLYINYRNDKLSYIEILLIELINIYLYTMTKTKNPFFITNVLIIILIFNKLIPGLRKMLLNLRINKYIPLFAFVFTLFLVYLPEGNIRYSLNHLLSGRLDFAKYGLEEYGISIFGSDVIFKGFGITDMSTEGYNYVDSSYINYLIRYGIINLIAIILFYVELINKSIKNKNIYLYISAITIIVIGIFEPFLYDLPFNIFPIIALSGYCDYEDNGILNKISATVKHIIEV